MARALGLGWMLQWTWGDSCIYGGEKPGLGKNRSDHQDSSNRRGEYCADTSLLRCALRFPSILTHSFLAIRAAFTAHCPVACLLPSLSPAKILSFDIDILRPILRLAPHDPLRTSTFNTIFPHKHSQHDLFRKALSSESLFLTTILCTGAPAKMSSEKPRFHRLRRLFHGSFSTSPRPTIVSAEISSPNAILIWT
jgi:hypothetical protein